MQTLSWQWGQTGLGHLHFLTHFPGNPQDKAVARMECALNCSFFLAFCKAKWPIRKPWLWPDHILSNECLS